eukprot:TRINITY_DN24387_c0_g1_i2.p1 TRINITY_DN24387_c0_g1~~TRINITY_DN24387_c0_g1_i2.p1  ORF type:complete len:201 (+),score=63.65 TRINITY_DN24387_c0_g1_i2:68-604(+)
MGGKGRGKGGGGGRGGAGAGAGNMTFVRQVPKFLQTMGASTGPTKSAREEPEDCGPLSDDEDDERLKAEALKEYIQREGAGNVHIDPEVMKKTVKSGKNLELEEALGVHSFQSRKKKLPDGDAAGPSKDGGDAQQEGAKRSQPADASAAPARKKQRKGLGGIKAVKNKSLLSFDEDDE